MPGAAEIADGIVAIRPSIEAIDPRAHAGRNRCRLRPAAKRAVYGKLTESVLDELLLHGRSQGG
jgi:hypothetical protein